MLIIDLDNKQIKNNPHFDTDIVVLKGATEGLITSLSGLVSNSHESCSSGSCRPPQVSYKVPLAKSRVPERTVTSLKGTALGGDQFTSVYEELSRIIDQATKPVEPVRSRRVARTFKVAKETRKNLQTRLATLLTGSPTFVEQLRLAVQGSNTLNPHSATATTRNIKAAIALYAYYSDETSFSSPDGCLMIAKLVQISNDTLTRLGTELNLLLKTGASNHTRYFVNRSFGQLLIRTLQTNTQLSSLLHNVDSVQNEIDNLRTI